MKKTLLLTTLVFALMVAIPAHALGGCEDSPENPTLVLAGLAGGAYFISSLRRSMRARRTKKDQSL
ncbi:MAG: PExPT-CTERM protein [Acidobacteriaceae bacterium]